MKSILIAIMIVCSATAFAAKQNKSCDAYMEAASNNSSPQVRFELGLKGMAVAAEANLTPTQESKILSNVTSFIAKNPKKQDDFEKMFYFVCTTELDADEKAQLKDQLLEFEKL